MSTIKLKLIKQENDKCICIITNVNSFFKKIRLAYWILIGIGECCITISSTTYNELSNNDKFNISA